MSSIGPTIGLNCITEPPTIRNGYLHLEGQIRNDTPRSARNMQVVTTLYADQQVLGAEQALVQEVDEIVPPGESRHFEVEFRRHFADWTHFACQAIGNLD
jgi:hypothetical protein